MNEKMTKVPDEASSIKYLYLTKTRLFEDTRWIARSNGRGRGSSGKASGVSHLDTAHIRRRAWHQHLRWKSRSRYCETLLHKHLADLRWRSFTRLSGRKKNSSMHHLHTNHRTTKSPYCGRVLYCMALITPRAYVLKRPLPRRWSGWREYDNSLGQNKHQGLSMLLGMFTAVLTTLWIIYAFWD